MAEVAVEEEFRCFVGGLAWATDDASLGEAFKLYGDVIESKVINDRETGRSRGFGFVTFREEQSMKDAIESMNGKDLDGRNITVHQAQQRPSTYNNNNSNNSKSRYGSSNRGGGGGGGGGGERGGYHGSERGGYRRTSSDGNGERGGYGGRRYGGARPDGRSDVGTWRRSDE